MIIEKLRTNKITLLRREEGYWIANLVPKVLNNSSNSFVKNLGNFILPKGYHLSLKIMVCFKISVLLPDNCGLLFREAVFRFLAGFIFVLKDNPFSKN